MQPAPDTSKDHARDDAAPQSQPASRSTDRSQAAEVSDMLDEGGGVLEPRVPTSDEAAPDSGPRRTESTPQVPVTEHLRTSLRSLIDDVRTRLEHIISDHHSRLTAGYSEPSAASAELARRVERLARQSELAFELLEAQRAGQYQPRSNVSVALLAAAMSHAAAQNPGRATLWWFSTVLTLAQPELRHFCEQRGLPLERYF